MLGINTNVASLTAQKNLSGSGMGLNNAIARLSSGLRVNSAKDDAAGLAIAERMQAQIKGYDVAARNANDGISLLQVADGAMGKISDNLQRMRELAVQAKNGTLNDTDRVNLNREYAELANEVDRIVTGSTFNGNNMFDAANKTLSFQVGTGNAVSDTLALNLTDDGLAAGNDLSTIMANGAASIQANRWTPRLTPSPAFVLWWVRAKADWSRWPRLPTCPAPTCRPHVDGSWMQTLPRKRQH